MAITEHYGERQPEKFAAPAQGDPLLRLSLLHEEACETARLANLLGRAIPAMITLAILTGCTLIFSGLTAQSAVWAALVLLGIGTMLHAWRRANAAPFARGPLQAFAQDLRAILLYAGFAWGAGAFLALPIASGLPMTVCFALFPALLLTLLLRERACIFAFIAPLAGLCALACVLRPLPDRALDAGLILLGLGTLAGLCLLAETRQESALPAGLVSPH